MKRILNVLLSFVWIFAGCSPVFIHDKDYMREVRNDLQVRSSVILSAGVCLDSMELSKDERQALEYLYAYMPLGDIVNMPAEYYLEHYRLMLQALDEMPWGKDIPERELRHFVLPVRVNNENLDTARVVFYRELAPRVKHMSMYDAVLEVNHWCHEKAVYMPSDRRTSSPLATVKTAYGRCGEESTLLVSALRSVGIPARQVYTPRWAHTDSNHAWVEAWVDGEWFFLGACEPEPVLNLGWFNAPASRGMLMHTKVFGDYDGPEEVVLKTDIHTEINVIDNYAPESASLAVRVEDVDARPVRDAKVEFKIYNYSSFETVATKYTDASGSVSLTAGIGDMLIYASYNGSFGFRKVSFGQDSEIALVLKYVEGSEIEHLQMEVVPPSENVCLPEVTPELAEENARRLAYEDSLRNSYVDTFYDMAEAEEFAISHDLCKDRVAGLLVSSRGNHDQIASFILKAEGKDRTEDALAMLESLAEKDLRDTPETILSDHLYNTPAGERRSSVLCPRVETELLTPYRSYLQKNVPQSLADSIRRDPALLVAWCRDNLVLHDDISLRYVQAAPSRVWDTRLADMISRDIFFVAMCRSFGVPSWRDSVTGVLKYESDGKVYDVDFDAALQKSAPQGRLSLRYSCRHLIDDPKYKTHFTLSKYEDGSFRLLNFNGSWSELFGDAKDMDCGSYMLTSGSRMSGGNVITDVEFFEVDEGKLTVAELVIRDDSDQIRVIGNFDSESRFLKVPSFAASSSDMADRTSAMSDGTETSILATTGRGYFAVALVDYGTEPTNHALKDISAAASQLEEWGRPLLVLFASEADYAKFRSEHFNLPSTVSYGIDVDGSVRRHIVKEMKINGEGSLPLILVADTFNRVVFFSQGYSIGLGERLVKVSRSL